MNGIRSALNKNVQAWISNHNPHILCLQEIKARAEQVDLSEFEEVGYKIIWNAANRPGYSGVITMYRVEPISYNIGMGIEYFDIEGRLIQTSHPDFELFNIYFPNGGRGYDRVQYKLDFYEKLLNICDNLHQKGKKIIITGDFNTAHQEIDLKNPKENEKTSGFLPEERIWIDKFIDHGFVDAYRELYPTNEQYTWWTYRFRARERGIGWRLDYFLISEPLMEKVEDVKIFDQVYGSDHCPVTLMINI